MNPKLPLALAAALEQGSLVVFCGAGISMLPPSNLPSWWGFNTLLLDRARRLALDGLPELPNETRERIGGFSLEDLPVQAFSQVLVQAFAGSSYFPVLKVLDSPTPNANHFALAELARRGQLRAIVSTNFDTLIERAFQQQGMALQVLASATDIESARLRSDVCTLFKIHGSVLESMTLVDTVQQKLRGLPVAVRDILTALFRDSHVLVVGYSGADLVFGDDYLALSAVNAQTPGLTWLVRPGSNVAREVMDVVEGAGPGGALLEVALPDVFVHCGIDLGALPKAARVGTASRLDPEVVVDDFFHQRHAGTWGAASFFVQLLDRVGEERHVDALADALAQRSELAPGPHGLGEALAAGSAVRSLAVHALRRGKLDAAELWSHRELALHEAVERLWAGQVMPLGTASELARNRSGVFINLAVVALSRKDFETATDLLYRAEQQALLVDGRDSLAKIALQRAQLLLVSEAGWDDLLGSLRPALALAEEVGDGTSRLEALLMRARGLIALVEYDQALEALDLADALLELAGDLRHRLQIGALRAAVAARRGDHGSAAAGLEDLVASARQRDAWATVVRSLLELAGSGLMSPALVIPWRSALDAVRPHVGEADRDEAAKAVAVMLSFDFTDTTDDPAAWSSFPGLDAVETALRQSIARLEAEQDTSALAATWSRLWQHRHQRDHGPRLLDLARGFLRAAERSGSPHWIANAQNSLGIAQDLFGHLNGAIAAFECSLAADPEAPASSRAPVLANLALARSRQGDDGAEAALREAVSALDEEGLQADALRTEMNLAKFLGRLDRLEEGLEILANAEERLADLDEPWASAARRRWQQLYNDLRFAERRRLGADLDDQDLDHLLEEPWSMPKLDGEILKRARARAPTPERMANLGIAALSSGLPAEARSLLEAAKDLYEQVGNFLGVSRCLNNLAAVEARDGRFEEALELNRRATNLRRELGDRKGEALSWSERTRLAFFADRPDEVVTAARQCLALLRDHGPQEARLAALTYLALVCGKKGELAEARAAARRRQRERALLGAAPDAREIEDAMEQLVRTVPPVPAGPKAEHAAQTALRLSQIGLVDEALELLDGLLAGGIADSAGEIPVLGNKAHVLANAGRWDEALELYRRVGDHFRPPAGSMEKAEVARLENWVEAERSVTKSLVRLNRGEEAETRLREVLANVPAGRARALVLRTLASTVQRRLMRQVGGKVRAGAGGQEQMALELAPETETEQVELMRRAGEEAVTLLREAVEQPDVRDLDAGVDRLNLGMALYQMLNNPDTAGVELREARRLLLRAGSAHADLCDHVLAELAARPREAP